MHKLLPILLFAYGLALTTDDIYDNSYALIIGIDKYENVSNLDYAVKDANSIASLLQDNFNFPSKNVTVLLNEEATFTNIRNGLSKVSSSAKANDRVLIYFAGHGETMDLPDGGEMGYLLPIDGKRDNLFATSILMDDLKKISSMTKAKHMLFLIDACYGGLAATGARGLSSTTPNFIDKITNDKSRQIITAGGRGEEVIEKSEWGHSAFTMNLIRALDNGKADLNDDGYITGDELGLFLKEKVSIDSENQQTPQSRRLTSHEGEFVFFSNHRANKPNLVSQTAKSSGDDIVVQKAVDGKQGWFEKYGYEGRAIEFVALEGLYQIGFVETIHKEWFVGFFYSHLEYSHLENNFLVDIIGLAPDESHSLIINSYMMDLGYKYFITERIVPFIAGDVIYNMISFKDVAEETSGDKNLIIFSASGGMWISIFQFDHGSFPMTLGTRVAITSLYSPSSYENYDGILTFDDWEIRLVPSLHLTFTFPK